MVVVDSLVPTHLDGYRRDCDSLAKKLDAHAALEAAHTEALDALARWHEWQTTLQELVPDDLWDASCAVLAKAGRRE